MPVGSKPHSQSAPPFFCFMTVKGNQRIISNHRTGRDLKKNHHLTQLPLEGFFSLNNYTMPWEAL